MHYKENDIVWLHPFYEEGNLIEGRVKAKILSRFHDTFYCVCVLEEFREKNDPDGLREGVPRDQIECIA